MVLADRQAKFTKQINALTTVVNAMDGYRTRDADCYRDERCNYGHPRSLHKNRLARDILLDVYDNELKKWMYQTDSKAYEWIGTIWKMMDPLNIWGGEWGDGNHFSSKYRGMK